jgi:intracellular multiplication protein IcmJ
MKTHAGNDTVKAEGASPSEAPVLSLSTQCKVWGHPPSNGAASLLGPAGPSDEASVTLKRSDYKCAYCGFQSQANTVDHINDNHLDECPQNLRAADPLCHGWHHLGELKTADAVVAYLPRLSPKDVNHFQRTLAVALQSDDAEMRSDARDLLNWMASHREYVRQSWGSFAPATFAAALVRQGAGEKTSCAPLLEHLALVYHPALFDPLIEIWREEGYAQYPYARWSQVYHSVVNPPV